jgi:predicted DNA-binding transcriptional regulator AlpA
MTEQTHLAEPTRPPDTAPDRPPDAAGRWRSEKLMISLGELSWLTSLSLRHLRRLDASRDIPGRVTVGRRVLFRTEEIREWIRAGLPDHDHWPLLLKRAGKR